MALWSAVEHRPENWGTLTLEARQRLIGLWATLVHQAICERQMVVDEAGEEQQTMTAGGSDFRTPGRFDGKSVFGRCGAGRQSTVRGGSL